LPHGLRNDGRQEVSRDRTDLQQLSNPLSFVAEVLCVHSLLDVVGVSIGSFPSYMGSHPIGATLCN
jgi:hypothetical protein